MSPEAPLPQLTREEYRQLLAYVRRTPSKSKAREWSVLLAAAVCWGLGVGLLAVPRWEASLTSVLLLSCALLWLQILLHECAHDSLLSPKGLNRIVGTVIGLLVLMPFGGFRRGHHAHHRHAGTELDPTAAPQGPRPGARLIETLVALRFIPVLYGGGVFWPYLTYDLATSTRPSRSALLTTLASLCAMAVLHLMLAWQFGFARYLVVYALGLWAAGLLYEYLFTQNQHVGLLPCPARQSAYRYREQINFTRSVRLPFAPLLLHFNLHKEHHLFPHLPGSRLPLVHQWLRTHRPDLLSLTDEHLGLFERRRHLRLFSPTVGDHDQAV